MKDDLVCLIENIGCNFPIFHKAFNDHNFSYMLSALVILQIFHYCEIAMLLTGYSNGFCDSA